MSGPILKGIEETYEVKRSPLAEGLWGALKGGVVGVPAGAVIAHLAGGSGAAGGFIGGLLSAAAFGAGHAMAQDIENKEKESDLRVHLENLKHREPFFYMPPRSLFERAVKNVR